MSEPKTSYIVAVAAVIFQDDSVLAMRRAAHKDAGAGLWETLSGRVLPHEEPLDAVKREIQEECGLTVDLDPRPLTAYSAWRGQEPMIVIVYYADYVTGEVVRSDEHDDHAWLSPHAFAQRSTLDKLVHVVRNAKTLRTGKEQGQ